MPRPDIYISSLEKDLVSEPLIILMSIPTSDLFSVQHIENAGRGVFALKRIEKGTLILRSDNPAAHLVFRQYRKEVCARCFLYDRGRTLPVRSNDVGKVFCSEVCQSSWCKDAGDAGIVAWSAFEDFARANTKAFASAASVDASGRRPNEEDVTIAWSNAQSAVEYSVSSRQKNQAHQRNGSYRPRKPQPLSCLGKVDPDLMAYYLSAILSYRQGPELWIASVQSLAMDPSPYRSSSDLEAHCNSFVQLHNILSPPTAVDDITTILSAETCQQAIQAASHNSFGLRSGSADGEEYIGYGLYPSASYFNHSCEPNVCKTRVGRAWVFTTSRDVQLGEQLCITYLGGDEKHLTVNERRARLQQVWGFNCMCDRCEAESISKDYDRSL